MNVTELQVSWNSYRAEGRACNRVIWLRKADTHNACKKTLPFIAYQCDTRHCKELYDSILQSGLLVDFYEQCRSVSSMV